MYLYKIIKIIAVAGLFLLATACSQEPAVIHYGSDECAHCKMMITDEQFASQIVTDKGKAIKFDAIECMAVYQRENADELQGAIRYVSDYNQPGNWIKAGEAQFVKSEVINSPMGESLLAFPSEKEAREHVAEKSGALLKWAEVSQIER
ncbi:nitrous oxide reductase accessory protein NosL [Aliifodinibius salicampi]|uniref:Nitrous oxide reductase accessory protein NosL n=1 Tax=Fodinibius salicampi TaxID=1920655 RepID=A0ABT3PXK5_9BACT|nr:nitrous oxide reductase accessory protein NosL [Fodinibius salicampi]MCW9712597.1 nitrous oxide reductase accessory protein NosL [Fodinibius salicampi]